jgi:hypothetical protein
MTNGFKFMVRDPRQGFRIRRHEARGCFRVDPDKEAGLQRRHAGACRDPDRAACRQTAGAWVGCGAIIKESLLGKECRRLNQPSGLRQRTRRHPKKPQRRASPVGRKLKNYPTLPQMECQPADFVQSRCNGLRACFSRPCWDFFHRWREGRDAAQLSP